MRVSTRFGVLALSLIASGVAFAAVPTDSNATLTLDARAALERAVAAARARDWPTLRAMMSEEFKHSFGMGGDDPDVAIQTWKKDEAILDEMVRVIGLGCTQRGDSISCSGEGGTSYRAALTRDATGVWKLKWFIAGD